jgi:peptidyl-Lys metalloendopeptidase
MGIVFLSLLLSLALAQFELSIDVYQNPLELNFTLSNPQTVPQTFLRWGTPVEGVWTDMFDIRDEQNHRLDYIGMIVRRGETPIEEEYITIPAGGSISTLVNLGDNYDFVSVGKYIIRVDLPLYCQLQYSATDAQVAVFKLDTIPERKPIGAPQGFTNCNSNQISQTNSAISGSISQSSRSYTCLNQGCDSLYLRWFGTYSLTNWNFVSNAFRNINNRLSNYDFTGYCNPAGCGSNVYGYVYPTDSTYTVYMCGLFWSRANERVNTIVHEMSHFRSLAGTQDYTYGQSNCLSLARSNPSQASHNADNVCYFAGEA